MTTEELIASGNLTNCLRIMICGGAGDGTSSLIGRLLKNAQNDPDSKSLATGREKIDYSLLPGGLGDERGSGTAGDVTCHSFSTDARSFLITDTPGSRQTSRTMIMAASTADLAILLVDARKGVVDQTRHHAYLLSVMGLKHIILAVNKIDLADYSHEVFDAIDREFKEYAQSTGFTSLNIVPISALNDENITGASAHMPWFKDSALLKYLETVDVAPERIKDLRFPLKKIENAGGKVHGFSGTLRGGSIAVGDEIMVASSLKKTILQEIITADKNLNSASFGDVVTLVLQDDIDAKPGDMLASPGKLPERSDQFQAKIIWLHDDALLKGRSYQLTIGTQSCHVQITDIKHIINVNTLEHLAAPKLEKDDIAVCNFATAEPIFFDAFSDNPATGCFILVDRPSKVIVGIGMIEFGLRRADNLSWQSFETDALSRAQMKGQVPSILWFTGLSASGKSTIVDLIDRKLIAKGVHTYVLDGDNVRHGLNKDLGFTDVDRVENIRRVAEVARLMADAGLVVLVSFISPFSRERKLAREIAGSTDFHEIFVDTPLEVCEERDPKGLYAKARGGDLDNFTGISSPFEAPEDPDLRLPGAEKEAEELADMVIEKFKL